ncbi:efflux RND transporter permease subunit [Arundinibacter roseus]|uniref:Efflux RND transporter permease subunit n=1 Tax=Arundinibacter roseus TaxID=2070510 RepID=A0A4R4KDB6_9BACT|nr:efflux RND transporter permease subunit [Arundinibacter roseus]TDB65818.1 efflux RND transporter permease subunit [Arundinibacter roseus]
MTRFLLARPIATFVVAFTLMGLGLITLRQLPISLLPDIPIPELTVQASYPAADARQIEQLVALPLRNQLLQLHHLDDLEAVSQDGQVTVKLRLDYGTDVDLAYLEANEKIDLLMSQFPRDMERPRVVKAGAGDLPVFVLNVWAANGDSADFIEVSSFAEQVIRKRLEQLPDIALVDRSGAAEGEWLIRPDLNRLRAAGLTTDELSDALRSRTANLGSLTIREGAYEYSIQLAEPLQSAEELTNTYLLAGKESPRLVRLGDFATVMRQEQPEAGFHTFNGQRAMALAIIKRSDAQVLDLQAELAEQVEQFRHDYPSLRFEVSQDQTTLLAISISNLEGSLLTGALLTLLMVFLFMNSRRILLIIAVLIPVSLAITMLAFYGLGLSINIVSLAGLVLGIGEIIDSAIIIIENIEQQRERGLSVADACVEGTGEVIGPLFTSVLTNSAVFLPLLFLSGIAGALFFDQAVSVTLALGISLLASYTLVPVMYHRLYRRQETFRPTTTRLMRAADSFYNRVFTAAFRYRRGVLVGCGLLLAGAGWIGLKIPKSGMPELSRTELEWAVDWNEPISPQENSRRIQSLLRSIGPLSGTVNAYVGAQDFLLNPRLNQAPSEALILFKVNSTADYENLIEKLRQKTAQHFPAATNSFRPAQNVFEQLFQTNEADLIVRVFDGQSQQSPEQAQVRQATDLLQKAGFSVPTPPTRRRILLTLSDEKLAIYQVARESLYQRLATAFGQSPVTTLQNGQQQWPVVMGQLSEANLDSILAHTFVTTQMGTGIPIKNLLTYRFAEDFAARRLGKEGAYVALEPILLQTSQELPPHQIAQKALAQATGFSFDFAGSYFRNQAYLLELGWVILIAVAMLFFILAAQFESLLQPFIVLLTIVFGTTGALALLYLSGGSLNIMSGVGLVVLIGLLDNDSILKIDTMNRSLGKLSLMESIREGGQRRLQSQLMTYFTTVLGLLPVLWAAGLGAELQKPLALTVLGGMTLGVLISWTFIPLMYWWLQKGKEE